VSAEVTSRGPLRTALSTLPVLVVLGGSVVHWTASQASGRLIQLGEQLWPGYAAELRRQDPEGETAARAAGSEGTDEAGTGASGAPTASAAEEDPLVAGLLADAGVEAPAAGTGDPLVDGLLMDAGVDPNAPVEAAPTAPVAAAPPPVPLSSEQRAFIQLDRGLSAFKDWGDSIYSSLLVLLVALCGATATATRGHIALGSARSPLEDRLTQGVQLIGNLLVAASGWALHEAEASSGAEIQDPYLSIGWALAFGLMALFNIKNLLQPVQASPGSGGGTLLRGALAVPLYVTMALLSSVWFLALERYPAGLAVYLQKLTEHAQLYVFVGLYVWTGMLLKQTRTAHMAFDVLRPWKMPPEVLAAVTVTLASWPTAYSGASGIFVIAVGGLIFKELRAAGARPTLALAATAMSGSLGVVLRPCLLVVIVAALNPVTTDELYGNGRLVFALTSGLFALALFLTRKGGLRVAPVREALPESLARLRALLPYVGVTIGVLGLCWLVLDAKLDEHTAPTVLPLVMLSFLLLERLRAPAAPGPGPVTDATGETTGHIGALILLMAMSLAFGGAFERAEVMSYVPTDLGSPFLAMGLLVVVLIVIGMLMDPYGAVILVAATISKVAYSNGIQPGHFWMTVLVAFELGYLTPPVALNQLLTRQVVGADEVDSLLANAKGTFWERHEHVLLPCSVMATALVLVAFVPLFFYSSSPAGAISP
jgi:TRAP-type C4-dicarboxylate transport system permease large subunit